MKKPMQRWLGLEFAMGCLTFAAAFCTSCSDFTICAPKESGLTTGGTLAPTVQHRPTPPPKPTAEQVHQTEVKLENCTWVIHYVREEADGTFVDALGMREPADSSTFCYFRARRCKVEHDEMTLTGWPQVQKGNSFSVALEPATGFVLKLSETYLRTFGGRTQTRVVE